MLRPAGLAAARAGAARTTAPGPRSTARSKPRSAVLFQPAPPSWAGCDPGRRRPGGGPRTSRPRAGRAAVRSFVPVLFYGSLPALALAPLFCLRSLAALARTAGACLRAQFDALRTWSDCGTCCRPFVVSGSWLPPQPLVPDGVYWRPLTLVYLLPRTWTSRRCTPACISWTVSRTCTLLHPARTALLQASHWTLWVHLPHAWALGLALRTCLTGRGLALPCPYPALAAAACPFAPAHCTAPPCCRPLMLWRTWSAFATLGTLPTGRMRLPSALHRPAAGLS